MSMKMKKNADGTPADPNMKVNKPRESIMNQCELQEEGRRRKELLINEWMINDEISIKKKMKKNADRTPADPNMKVTRRGSS